MHGRFFPVSPKGEIVGEYVRLYFSDGAVASNTVYRAQPVPYDWAPAGTPRAENAVVAPPVTDSRVR